MARYWIGDLKLVFRGAEKVAKALVEHQSSELNTLCRASNITRAARKIAMTVEDTMSTVVTNPQKAVVSNRLHRGQPR